MMTKTATSGFATAKPQKEWVSKANNKWSHLPVRHQSHIRPLLGILTCEQVKKQILAATDDSRCGRRDRSLLQLLNNTRAREPRASAVRVRDVLATDCCLLQLRGKDDKHRLVPRARPLEHCCTPG